jgi:hypothetical protein
MKYFREIRINDFCLSNQQFTSQLNFPNTVCIIQKRQTNRETVLKQGVMFLNFLNCLVLHRANIFHLWRLKVLVVVIRFTSYMLTYWFITSLEKRNNSCLLSIYYTRIATITRQDMLSIRFFHFLNFVLKSELCFDYKDNIEYRYLSYRRQKKVYVKACSRQVEIEGASAVFR